MTVGRTLGVMALALSLIAGIGPTLAQEGGGATSDVEQRRQRLEAFEPDGGGETPAAEPGGADHAFPDAPDRGSASPETKHAYEAALQAYYAYRKAGYEHRLGVFAWQSISTKIIFFIVLLLVLAGIYFAAIQFHSGLRRRGDAAGEETEVSLSLSEVKVRSPVLGVIILTISLAFFYLYLVHVYPIRNVF